MQYCGENVEESWRPIIGYEGSYEISNLGRVKSLKDNHLKVRKIPIILKPSTLSKGYLGVTLGGKTHKIHRLVAKVFIPNPYNLPEVNHRDENKSNNCSLNLEWCSTQYNLSYGTARERINSTNKARGSAVARKIEQYTMNGAFIRGYNSITEAIKFIGAKNNASIIKSCKDFNRTAYGYRWKYKNIY